MPSPMHLHTLLALLSFLPFLFFPTLSRASSPTLETTSSKPSSPRAPLLMLSTMDGTVSAFDAHTGDLLFTYRDDRPAVDSWAAPGVHEYVPSLDGHLYRIDRATEEAHLVDSKFINLRATRQEPSPNSEAPVHNPDVVAPAVDHPADAPDIGADAVILTQEESSVLYVDLRTGRVLRQVGFGDMPEKGPLLPGRSEHVIVVSRTTVGVRVMEVESGRVLANASLLHTVPSYLDRGKCLKDGRGEDKYIAYMTAGRDRVTVKSRRSGKVLWSKEVTSPVVEAHGMGGVRIGSGGREEMIGDGDKDVIVAKEAGYTYAMLAGPQDKDADHPNMLNDGREERRYRLRAEGGDFLALEPSENGARAERVPSRRETVREEAWTGGDVQFMITSREAGLGLLTLISVGLVGYVVGRHPRKTEKQKRRVRRRKKRPMGVDDVEVDAEGRNDGETSPGGSDTDPDEGDELHEEELETPAAKGGGRRSREVSADRDGGFQGNPRFPYPDAHLESSTGSTGSGGGGVVSNRSKSGWMSVGSLMVSSKVLGVGAHGTVVYEGKMMPGERKVAVKRLLRQFYESARQEISLLVELDEASPHVVRYFAMEEDSEFIYLALELCAASLAERVTERQPPVPPASYIGGPPPIYCSRALRQLLQGLADLHRVGVVHRDVKPQNVLIARPSTSHRGDVKLADVGLALRLAANRSSYTAVTNAGGGVGTTGWRAPEVLSGGRQTKAVDIFAAGCIVSFVLTGGQHPFGNAIFGRDGNIAAGKPSLESLEALELPEATDIVRKMIDPVATKRPSAEEALKHPFFWTDAMKLSFLVDISDRLYDTRHDPARYTETLDRYEQSRKYCSDWLVRMDMELLTELGRGYENTASGLLRVIRNKRNHYSELPASIRKMLGELPEEKHRSPKFSSRPDSSGDSDDSLYSKSNFLTYFTSRVPQLLMCVYQYATENPVLIDQPHFERYGLKPLESQEQVPLHPLVRRARGNQWKRTVSGSVTDTANAGRPTQQVEGERVQENDGVLITEPGHEDVEVIVATKPTRRAYHRHELVAIQSLCRDMTSEVQCRVMALSLYQPATFARLRKRLNSNLLEESDIDDLPAVPEENNQANTPSGAPRYIPKRHSLHRPSAFASKAQPSHAVGSPTGSRPPGLSGGPPGFPGGGPYGYQGAGPPGFSGYPHGKGAGSSTPQFPRRSSTPAITPTVSQFSGEERIVDFGALRRK
eukprot:GFKZ01003243.1.p1 GENE.GFKZ01003243.1~~GFKZ01003243.1.p1  ORF type:complete len:1233 (+),score=173.28 GFKZ01003243.1:43-3699(+)